MIHLQTILINLIITLGVCLLITQSYFFVRLSGGGSARHLRGCLDW